MSDTNLGGYWYGVAFHAISRCPCFEDDIEDDIQDLIGLSLNDPDSNRLYQRDAGEEFSTITFTGGYEGGAPAAIQAKVFLASDDSTVVDWTNLSDFSATGGGWAGTLAVPQGDSSDSSGGKYYVHVRDSVDTNIGDQGVNEWFVGIMVSCYGQSNMESFTNPGSGDAAVLGTTYFNGTVWTTVPSGQGVRKFLNVVATESGIPVGLLNGAVSGQAIEDLDIGSTHYNNLIAQVTNSGCGSIEYMLWHQGEGNAAGAGTLEATYLGLLADLHDDFATAVGRTTTTLKWLNASLGHNENEDIGTNTTWQTIKDAQFASTGETPGMYFSHSMVDGTLTDGLHFTDDARALMGERFAQSVLNILGVNSNGMSHWDITGGEVIDSTNTQITVIHSLGTDFTVGDDGWEVSGDNGGTWETPTVSRIDATTINLLHSELATNNNRKVRYQYGYRPDDNPAEYTYDNSSLSIPLTYTYGTLSPTPLESVPEWTYRASAVSGGGSGDPAVYTYDAINVVDAAEDLMLVMAVVCIDSSMPVTTATITPDGGSPISGTVVQSDATSALTIVRFAVPSGTDLTAADISITITGASFGGSSIHCWTVPQANINSMTHIDSDFSVGTTVSSRTLNISTVSGGLWLAAVHGTKYPLLAAPTWSGDETGINTRAATVVGAGRFGAADVVDTGDATNDNEITATWSDTVNPAHIIAASWR